MKKNILQLAIITLLQAYILFSPNTLNAYTEQLIIPRLKYSGGGDWYTGPTSMPNLLRALNERFGIPARYEDISVSLTDPELFRYPMLYMTGHGHFKLTDSEASALMKYLENGGFLWINDSYGLERFVKREIKKIYPDEQLQLLPADHPIYNNVYHFPDGLPKIHEHDAKPPEGLAIFRDGKMKILYLFESDIGDGLEDAGIHKADTPEIREKAMKMAINIVFYAMTQ
ncbi:MAG: DUF4159 domain-containing protein [Candidatus Riflebacteria bacterium]|nr:DUF4159 domain-containing protein [Candidatus Riflebacteria bacterium]